MNRGLLVGLAIVMVVSGGLAAFSGYKLLNRPPVREVSTRTVVARISENEKGLIESFELTERSGKTLGNQDLKGQVWVGSFFYATCPGSCRVQNTHLATLQQKFAKKGVKIVSITCDPKTDTPDKLRMYADEFQAKPDAWYFLTGELDQIKKIGTGYFQVFVSERGHMDRFVAVDKWGNIRGYFDWHNPEKLRELEAMLDSLLAETEPPAEVPDPFATVNRSAPSHAEDAEEEGEVTEEATEAVSEAVSDESPEESSDESVEPAATEEAEQPQDAVPQS